MAFPLSSARGPFWSNTSDGVDYISRVALIMVYVPSVPQKEFVNLTIPDGLFELIFQSLKLPGSVPIISIEVAISASVPFLVLANGSRWKFENVAVANSIQD